MGLVIMEELSIIQNCTYAEDYHDENLDLQIDIGIQWESNITLMSEIPK